VNRITSRGNERNLVFKSGQDRISFLNPLQGTYSIVLLLDNRLLLLSI
jgi:hypothetical protein